jgi:hypothetical protein
LAASSCGQFVTVSGRTVRPLGVERQECLFWLCRMTALHYASSNGHTETALALITAGADMRCKDNDGYGFWRLHRCVGWVATVSGRTVRPIGVERQECLFWLCRMTALHAALNNGHTATALALVTAGADVHCKTNFGYGCSGCILVSVVFLHCGADGPSTGGGAAGEPVLAVQTDGAALGVVERPHGDGAGAGQGGRGRALQGQQRVRVLGLHPCAAGFSNAGRKGCPLGVELQG